MNRCKNRMINSNPFLNKTFSFYDNDYDFFNNDQHDFDLFCLKHENNFLNNFKNIRKNQMDEENKFVSNLYSCRNKIMQRAYQNNEKKKKILDELEHQKNEKNIEIEKYNYELNDILDKKENEKLKKKNYSTRLNQEIENQKKLIDKKKEQKLINKRAMQKKFINDVENNAKVELIKYKKDKILEKENQIKKYLLDKNKLKIKTNLEINDLKHKSEMVPRLMLYFDKTKEDN